MLRAFFAFVEKHGENEVPADDLARALARDGDAALAALLEEGIVRGAGLAKSWSCEEVGCDGRLVVASENGAFLALCTREPVACETLTLAREELAQQRVSMDALLAVVRRELRIDRSARPASPSDGGVRQPAWLGEQGTASPRDVFWTLAPNPWALAPFFAAREHAPRPTLLLVPTLASVDPELVVVHAAGAKVEIDALAEALGVRDGRIVALRRLRAAPSRAATDAPPAPAPSPSSHFPLVPRARAWNQVRIVALDRETVLVTVGRRTQKLTYIDLGMGHKLSRKPRKTFLLLLAICAGGGTFRWSQFSRRFGTVKELVSELRKALCAAFGIEDDPFHGFSYRDQWRAKFVAGTAPIEERAQRKGAWAGATEDDGSAEKAPETAWSVAFEDWEGGTEPARSTRKPPSD
jgi:hypothetical protein